MWDSLLSFPPLMRSAPRRRRLYSSANCKLPSQYNHPPSYCFSLYISSKVMAKSPENEHPLKAFGWAARDSSGVLSPFKFSSKVGSEVQKYKVGDKVGVGCMVGACRSCDYCTQNLENHCPKIILTYNHTYYDGTRTYGGYSNFIVVDKHFVLPIPNDLPLDAAAPLLCSGISTYSPLIFYGLNKPGMHVGVVGLGGLGHVTVKMAKAFGVKAAMGTMDGIIDTVSAVHPLLPLIGLMKCNGKLVMLGSPKALELPVMPLLMAKHNIIPLVEVIPIDYVNTAMERLEKADVKYRFVIDIGNTLKAA
ncbi:hypothetical protein F0562_003095 [Nyssa sinensis]|uniref:Alcohol dehydrogenase-like N-terminal domain-containing protein n=1 Tax=Nyssa sinensis TaxID=561372 RepID=A0A5J5BVL0_9ASTE|nr:hypothetical protein F0562_003095 [Nyssa sinensis]